MASREVRIQRDDGPLSSVSIELYAPSLMGDEEWSCRYRIVGLRRTPIDEASVGIDGIQATHLAIQMIANWMLNAENEPGQQVLWPEGAEYDNLELCERSRRSRSPGHGVRSRADAMLDWEIEEALSAVRDDPDGAGRAFRRLRRRAARRQSSDDVIRCLFGLLAVARRKNDPSAALRVVRAISTQQPSWENLLTCARELGKHGRDEEARALYAKALPQIEEGTSLYRFVESKLVGEADRPEGGSA